VYIVTGDAIQSQLPTSTNFTRTNLRLLCGTGATLDGYEEVLRIRDDRGIVYPMVLIWGDNYHVVYSTSPLRLDVENTQSSSPQYQGKELMTYLRVREK
jgi:hypothetical protein